MELARRMQRTQPLHELAQRRTEPVRVDARRLVAERRRRSHRQMLRPGPHLAGDAVGARRVGRGKCLRSSAFAPLHVVEEVRSFDELHREKERAGLRLNELVKANEVAVVDVRDRAKLLLEEVDRVRIDAQQRLQGDGPMRVAVERLVDDAHSPRADSAQCGVTVGAGPVRTCRERQRRSLHARLVPDD